MAPRIQTLRKRAQPRSRRRTPSNRLEKPMGKRIIAGVATFVTDTGSFVFDRKQKHLRPQNRFPRLSPLVAGWIAQLVEQRIENPRVPSSILGPATTFPFLSGWRNHPGSVRQPEVVKRRTEPQNGPTNLMTERWLSGLRHTPGKRAGSKGPREFESLPLRHSTVSDTTRLVATISFVYRGFGLPQLSFARARLRLSLTARA